MGENKDISRQAVVVLVFLGILVTLLGTLTVMTEVSKVNGASSIAPEESIASSQGTVELRILKPGEQEVASTTGRVTMRIV